MRIYTIETCEECPEFRPNPLEYTSDGKCARTHRLPVIKFRKPPQFCPLKKWKGEE